MEMTLNGVNEAIDKKLLEAEKAEENGMKWYTQEEYDMYFSKKENDKCTA